MHFSLPLLACSALAQSPIPPPQERPSPGREEPTRLDEPPALVLLVVCDQLIPEQLDRLAPWLDGGLARFWDQGRSYRRATLSYARTETGPGHASLSTGCLPSRHGIVGNQFFDRTLGKTIYCMTDSSVRALTSAGPADSGSGSSPHYITAPTLAETLLAADSASRVFSVSMKDRSAICMAGPAPAWAVWWDKKGGGFMSSTHYGSELPPFVSEWNASWREQASGWEWTPSFEDDPTPLGTAADDRPGESPYGEHGIRFPYRLSSLDPEVLSGADREAAAAHLKSLASDVYGYPLGDQFTLQVAEAALDALKLGQDEHPDLLAVSLSSCDAIGHSFGPYSWEVTDLLLRTDKALGEFLDLLDERVGPGRWVGVLTADHGVLELPEALQARGIGAKRIGRVETGVFTAAVTQALEAAHGVRFKLGFNGRGFSLDPLEVTESGLDAAALRRTMADASVQAHWVAAAYTLEDLMGEASPSAGGEEPWLALYRASTYPGRCLDVVLRPDPWVLMSSGRGTSHGSPYEYDRRIPLAFLGSPFPAGSSFESADSKDVVPTLLPLLGLAAPGPVDGRDLLASPASKGASEQAPAALPVLPAPVERPTSVAGPQRVVENYDSGQERSEGYVLGDGTKIGVWTVWHENGQKWMEYEYRNGLMDGPFLKWYPNGRKRTVGEYKRGEKEGVWTAWYEAAQLDGAQVSGLMWEGTHRADKKDGPWTFWSVDGSINGELSGIYRNDEKTVERP